MPDDEAKAIIWDRMRLSETDLIVDTLEVVSVAELEGLINFKQ